jgi:SAM-dependent methyltransferase
MKTDNPGAIIEDSIRQDMLEEIFRSIGKRDVLLDVGCGSRPYMQLYKNYFSKTIGADLQDSPFEKYKVDIFCNAVDIPLSDSSVDVHFSSEVLHDISEPSALMDEAFRLLRPGGYIVLTAPFMVPVCDGEYDHYRYTRHGLHYLFLKAGFKEIEIKENGGLIATIIQLCIKPHLRIWNKISKVLHFPLLRSFWNPFLLLFVFFPQAVYVAFYHAGKKNSLVHRLMKIYPNSPIGHVCIARKPND